MARLIDADKAVEYMNQVETDSPFDDKEDILEKCVHILDLCPTIDAVSVVHGQWEWYDLTISFAWINRGYMCSVCEYKQEDETNYCPNCGAKMEGGNENAAD